MSDSGFPDLPAGPRHVSDIPGRGEREGQSVRILGVPNELRNIRQPVRLHGDIIRENTDGSLRVRTERGDIDIQVSARQPRPVTGQHVEIHIQPGRPPDHGTIRPAPEQSAHQAQTTRPSTAGERHAPREQTQAEPATPRSAATPVNIETGSQVRPAPTITIQPQTETPQTLPQTLPPPETLVHFQAISPRQTAEIIQQTPLQVLVSQITQATDFKAQLITLEAQSFTLTETLNIQPQTIVNAQQIPPVVTPATPAPQPVSILPENIFVPPPPLATFLSPESPAPLTISFLPAQPATPIAAGQGQTPPQPVQFLVPELLSQALTPIPVSVTETLQTQAFQPGLAFDPVTNSVMNFVTQPELPAPLKAPLPLTPEHSVLTARIEATAIPALQLTEPAKDLPAKTELPAPAPLPPQAPLILQNMQAGSLTAVVTGTTAENLPVVTFAFPQAGETFNFVLLAPVESVPVGTQLQVTPQTIAASEAAVISAGTATPQTPGIFLTPQSWPLMQDIYQSLARIAPPMAQALSNVTPSPANPAQMGPAALFFLAAIRAGDISGWLGDKTIDALRRSGRGNLLTRITQEGGMLSRLSAEPVSQDWRAMSLPLFWQGEMHKVALHYKHDHYDQDSDAQKGKQTRFIFDLNLSHMGKVQLDGLFRQSRLDLIVRTEEPFSQTMQMEMRRIYGQALGQTQITGELSFQNRPEQWVTIQSTNANIGLSA